MHPLTALVEGILFPQGTLQAHWFVVLAAFVAINTVMYIGLSVIKAAPRLRPWEWLPRRYRRAETRSIHPEAPS